MRIAQCRLFRLFGDRRRSWHSTRLYDGQTVVLVMIYVIFPFSGRQNTACTVTRSYAVPYSGSSLILNARLYSWADHGFPVRVLFSMLPYGLRNAFAQLLGIQRCIVGQAHPHFPIFIDGNGDS
ncbi:hypothetical protein BD309DRAFT_737600 [Dichomitus squalens]|uniref:Uncharacterized protein n=1 Tax=Dichomitus squalens TaxID=114155 RepID=A0A4V2K2E6_9APHY|nr:hypothetical protein BD311DRAFT_446191 [Dichomitus squalens]TBU26507.1 hypothetical protein BD311DRAFT_446522 [Dichomitus squalens]TBU36443.1 hypothetical protein BD309DRAFT_737600 [Dichomitus squalens]